MCERGVAINDLINYAECDLADGVGCLVCAQLVVLVAYLLDLLAHAAHGRVQDLPHVELGQLGLHLVREDPVDHRRALDYLRLQHLVDHDHHHLVFIRVSILCNNVLFIFKYSKLGFLPVDGFATPRAAT